MGFYEGIDTILNLTELDYSQLIAIAMCFEAHAHTPRLVLSSCLHLRSCRHQPRLDNNIL